MNCFPNSIPPTLHLLFAIIQMKSPLLTLGYRTMPVSLIPSSLISPPCALRPSHRTLLLILKHSHFFPVSVSLHLLVPLLEFLDIPVTNLLLITELPLSQG